MQNSRIIKLINTLIKSTHIAISILNDDNGERVPDVKMIDLTPFCVRSVIACPGEKHQ